MLVDLDLARRIESALAADLVDYARAMAGLEPTSGAGWDPVGGGTVTYTGPGMLGARGQGLGLHGPVSPDEVDQMVGFLHDRGAAGSVEVCPLADSSLVDTVATRGLGLSGFRDVLVADPGAASSDGPPAGRSGLAGGAVELPVAIELVGPAGLAEWSRVLLDGFGYGPGDRRARLERWNAMMGTLPQARLLLARIDGEAVGASNVLIHPAPGGPAAGGTASLGGTATLPSHRCRGVQLALLRARLRLARAEGCDLAVVTADPGSSSGRNARRAGFTLAYTSARLDDRPRRST